MKKTDKIRKLIFQTLGWAAVCFSISTLSSVSPAFADTLGPINPTDDSYINQSSGATSSNYGNASGFYSMSWSGGNNNRGVLMFDLSSIPAGSTITDVSLVVREINASANARTHDLHRITASWTEGAVTWNNINSSYDAAILASINPPSNYNNVAFTFNSGLLVSHVQDILNGTVSNYGWMIKDSVEQNGSQVFRQFGTVENSISANRPTLTVTYTPPTCTATTTGNWNDTNTWGGNCGGAGGIPDSTYAVTINDGVTVTVNVDASTLGVTLNAPSTANGITISGTNTLTVSGAITMNSPSAAVDQTIAVGAGTLTAASIAIPGSATGSRNAILSASTGIINISGNIAFSGTAAQAKLTTTGAATINVGGNFTNGGTLSLTSGTLIKFNGSSAQQMGTYTTYKDVQITNTGGTVSMQGVATVVNMTINSGAILASSTLTVSGNITNNGTRSAAVTMTGTDAIIDGTGSFSVGTFTLNTAAKSIASTANLTFGGVIAITGAITVTNNGIVNANSNLTGSVAGSTWVNAANSTLKIKGSTLTTGTLTATASGNSMQYVSTTGAQTVKGTTYENLVIAKSAQTATLGAATVIQSTGGLTITSGTLNLSSFSFTNNATTSVTGTLNDSSSLGTNLFVGLITVNNGGNWSSTNGTSRGGIISNGSTFNAGSHVFDTNSQSLTGALSIDSVTVTGITLTNNNTLTVAANLTGTGGLTQADNATLNFGAGSTITTLTATASGNTVNYTSATADQLVKAATYHNLTINKPGWTATVEAGGLVANGTFTLTAGTLDTSSRPVTAANFVSSNTNTRSIIIRTDTTFELTGTGTVWDVTDPTNLTLTPEGSTIKLTNASASSKTFSGGGKTYADLWITGSGSGAYTIAGSNGFRDFKVDTPPHTVNFTAGTTQAVTTWTTSGTAGNLITMQSTTPDSAWNISDSTGTNTADYVSLRDSAAAGGATWDATHATNVSGNSGWNISGGAPTVSGVSASTSNGSYNEGDVVAVTVTFSDSVTVSGTPQLTLSTGSPATTAVNYSSGSPGTVLTFNYTVGAGNTSADLDYAATDSLALNGGTINATSGGAPATLTLVAPGAAGSLGNAKDIVIDTAAPTNQDTVYAAGESKASGATVTIVSSGDATNNVWFAPSGTTSFAEGATMTKAASGTATSILAPASGGSYKLFVIDAAGNISTASTATLTVDATAPTAAMTYSAAGPYKSGASVTITATFSEAMLDAPIPKIEISGANTVAATNMTKTDTTHYTYVHTVGAGNGTQTVALSVGTDAVGNVVTAAPTSGATSTVDNTAPTAAITYSVAGPYKSGASVTITATFSEAMLDAPIPKIEISGANTVAATNMTKSSTTVYTYAHTVGAGNGTETVALSVGTDAAGNVITAAPSSGADSTVDNTAPNAPSAPDLAAADDSGSSNSDNITYNTTNLTFSGTAEADSSVQLYDGVSTVGSPVTATGGNWSVDVSLAAGAHTITAKATDAATNLSIASAGLSVTVDTTVPTVDVGNDVTASAQFSKDATTSGAVSYSWGKQSGTGVLTFGSGSSEDTTISSDTEGTFVVRLIATDTAGNAALDDFTLIWDTTATTVSSVTSTSGNATYKIGDAVNVTVNFNENVTVTGTPQITLALNPNRAVNYSSGTGSSALVFTYTVQAGDNSADLDYAATNSLALNSGTIKDAAGNNATLTLATPGQANSLGNAKSIVIDGIAPVVSSVTSDTANGTYRSGDTINIQVVFDGNVTVTGIPQITLANGGGGRVVDFSSGSGSDTLVFVYTVPGADTSLDLDYTATDALALNSGTIRDAAGNNATLTLAAPGTSGSLGNAKNIVIDNTAPTVSSVTATNGSYKAGQNIDITVNFNEAVTVVTAGGIPRILLETGDTDRYANYVGGSSTSALVFRYAVQAGDSAADLNYFATTSLGLNSGTMKDAVGNDATLTLPSLASGNSLAGGSNVIVDTNAPTVSSVSSSSSNSSYTAGQTVAITINFSENVTVDTAVGNPRIQLETGGTDQNALYNSGSGTGTLTFNYTVQAGDTASDLDYVTTNSLTLNSGTIRDTAGNNATLTLASPGAANSLGNNKNIVIDSTNPVSAAGNDASVADVATISLSGTCTDTNALTGTWTQTAGTSCGTISGTPDSGASVLTATASCTAPDVAANGNLTFRLTCQDTAANSHTDDVVITVNAKPAATAQSPTAFNEEVVKNITLAGTDPDSEVLTFSTTGCSAPTKGTLSGLNSSTGAIVYTPTANENGADSFGFKVNDGTQDSACATVSLTINAVNDAPTLSTISTISGQAEDSATTISYATLAGVANEADIDADALSFRIESVTTGGLTKGGSAVEAGVTTLGADESVVWTPANNANGTLNAFTVKAYDGTSASADAVQVQVSVATANDAPSAAAGADQNVNESAGSVSLSGTSSSDTDSDALTYAWTETADAASACSISSATASAPTVTIADKSADYTCTYSLVVNDGTIDSAADTMVISVAADNDAPVASSVSYSGTRSVGQTLTGAYTYSDPEGETEGTSTFRWLRGDTLGGSYAAIGSATNSTYVLTTADAHKYIKFEVIPKTSAPASGSAVLSSGQIVNNAAPVAAADVDQNVNETAGTVSLSGSSSSDADSDALTYAWSETADAATACSIANATTATPTVTIVEKASNYSCTYSLVVNDGTADSVADAMVINVTADNDAPTAAAGADQNVNESAGSASLSGTASSDPEGAALTYAWTETADAATACSISSATASAPTVTLAEKTSNYSCTYSLVVNDGTSDSAADAMVINVTADNDVPTASAVSYSGTRTVGQTLTGAYTYADPESEAESSSTFRWLRSATLNGEYAAIGGATGSTYVVVAADSNKYLKFEVTPKNAAGTGSAVLSTGQQVGNTAPVANAGTDQSVNEDAGSASLSAAASSDADNDTLTYAWTETADAASACLISSATASAPTVTLANKSSDYSCTYSLVVNDGTANSSADEIVLSVTANNDAPAASSVSYSGTRSVGQTLTGSYSYSDPEGETEGTSTFRWLRADTVGGTYSAIGSATSSTYVLVAADAHKYIKFEVTPKTDAPAAGSAVLSSGQLVNNTAPVAAAGVDQNVNETAGTVSLSGSSSSDADSDALTYAWTETADAASGCSIVNATTATPTVTIVEKASSYSCTYSLVVNDGTIDSAADTMMINVTSDNDAPTAAAGADQNVNESAGSVSLSGTSSSDPEGAALTYAWSETADAASACSISSATASAPTITIADKTSNYSCTYSLVVNDGTSDSAADDMVINVTADNDVPTASAISFSGTRSVGQTLTGVYTYADLESEAESGSTFRWLRSSDDSSFSAITDATSQTYVLVAADAHKYIKFEVTPKNATGTGSAVASSSLQISNTAPVANAGADQNVNESAGSASLNGSSSTDADSDALTYAWTETVDAASACSISGATTATPTVTLAEKVSNYSCTYSLVVNDGTANSAADTMVINVTANDDAPTANSGADQNVNESAGTVGISGTSSSDLEGQSLTYAWTETADSASACSISSATASAPTITIADKTSNYSCTYSLVVNDGTSDSAADEMVINVTADNDAPTANSGADQNVNESAGTVSLSGTSSSDPEGSALTYSWSETADAASACSISSATASAPTITIADKGSNYSCTYSLVVNDGTNNSAADAMVINVTVDNDAPTANSGADQNVNESAGTVSISGASSSDPEGSALTYAWTETADVASACSISSATASAPTITIAEKSSSYSCTYSLVVNDGTADSAADAMVINVTADNDAPTANSGADQNVNESAGTVSLSGTDSSDLEGQSLTYAWSETADASSACSISSATASAPTITIAEKITSYSCTYSLVVNDGTSDSSSDAMVINVTADNDAPTASSVSFSGTLSVGQTLTGSHSYSDPESVAQSGSTYRWLKADTSGGSYLAISGATSSTYVVDAADSGKYIKYEVTPSDGVTTGSAVLSSASQVGNTAPTASSVTISGTLKVGQTLTGSYSYSDADNNAESGSTFRWLRASTSNGEYSAINSATNATYVLVAADAHKFVKFEVTPNDGSTAGSAVLSSAATIANSAPTASSVAISGTLSVGQTLTGSYTYSDADNDVQSGSTFRWLRADTSGGTYSAIAGATASTYVLAAADSHKFIKFEVIPNDGADAGSAYLSGAATIGNAAPVANAGADQSVNETAVTVSLSGSGTDADGNSIATYLWAETADGSSACSISGAGTATPTVTIADKAANYTCTYTLVVNDGTSDSAADEILISVTADNDAPTLSTVNNLSGATEDTALTIIYSDLTTAANESDPEGAAIAFRVEAVSTGTLTKSGSAVEAGVTLLSSGQSLVWTPAANANGLLNAFTIRAHDGTSASALAIQVKVDVATANDAPTATAQSVTVTEEVALGITLAGTDPEGSSLTYTVVGNPSKGVLSGTAPNLTYTPNGNATGADSFTFKVNDGIVDSSNATVSITINNVNDTPTANAQSVSTNEDIEKAITLTASDPDSGDTLTYTIVSATGHGVLSGSGASKTYAPTANYSGSDSFTFKVNDGTVDSNTVTVSITVTAVNDAPTAGAQTVSAVEDTAIAITLVGTDPENSALTYALITSPDSAKGTLGTLNTSTGVVLFTPTLNASGSTSFNFKTNDGTSDSSVATVTINIAAVNDAPDIKEMVSGSPQTLANKTVTEGQNLMFVLTGIDPEGNTYGISVSGSLPGSGSATPASFNSSTKTFSWTPGLTQSGTYSVIFSATDQIGATATRTMTITVTNVNQPPTIPVIANQTGEEGTALSLTVPGTDPDSGDTLTYSVNATTPEGFVSPCEFGMPTGATLNSGTGVLTWTPSTAQGNACYAILFRVTDAGGLFAERLALFTIQNVNQTPVLTVPSARTASIGTVLTFTVTATDVDGDTLTLAASSLPTGATFSAGSGSFSWTPTTAGSFTATFTATDNGTPVRTDTDSVTITVASAEEEEAEDDPVAVVCIKTSTSACATDHIVQSKAELTLTADTSQSPKGTQLIYTWSQVGGSAAELKSTNGTAVSDAMKIVMPEVPENKLMRIKFKLVVNDGKEDSDPAYATIRLVAAMNEANLLRVPFKVFGAENVDSDSDPEVIIMEPVTSSSATSSVISFADVNGSLKNLSTFTNVERKLSVTVPVSNPSLFDLSFAVDDTDGDGKPDLAMGMPTSEGGKGSVYTFGGVHDLKGKVIDTSKMTNESWFTSMKGETTDDRLGRNLRLKDIDNDGKADFMLQSRGGSAYGNLLIVGGGDFLGRTMTITADSADYVIEGSASLDLRTASFDFVPAGSGNAGGQLSIFSPGAGHVYVDFAKNVLGQESNTITMGNIITQATQDGRSGSGVGAILSQVNFTSVPVAVAPTYIDGTTYTYQPPANYIPPSGYTYDGSSTIYGSQFSIASKDISGVSKSAGMVSKASDSDSDSEDLSTNEDTGDVNGDTYVDAVVGDPSVGKVYVYYGTALAAGVADSSADVTVTCPSTSEGCGQVVLVADITGDGKDDIIIGAPLGDGEGGSVVNAGNIYAIYGSSNFSSAITIVSGEGISIVYGTTQGGQMGGEMIAMDSDGNDTMEIVAVLSDDTSVIISFDTMGQLGKTLTFAKKKVGSVFANRRAVMLRFNMKASTDADTKVDQVTLTAAGTGADSVDIEAIYLYEDMDDDGELDKTDRKIAGPYVFTRDNGTLTLKDLNQTIAAGASQNWIVIYQFTSAAGGSATSVSAAKAESSESLPSAEFSFPKEEEPL